MPSVSPPNLIIYGQKLAEHGYLVLSENLLRDLKTISVSTVRRYLARIHQDEPYQRRQPRPPTGLLANIPIQRTSAFEAEPGHFEVDLVHHSGAESKGEYVYTLNMVDVATGWSEMGAILGRSQRVMAVVRAWLGHERLDSAAQAKALNCIYDQLWIYQNFFQPLMRLKSKEVDPVTHRIRRS